MMYVIKYVAYYWLSSYFIAVAVVQAIQIPIGTVARRSTDVRESNLWPLDIPAISFQGFTPVARRIISY